MLCLGKACEPPDEESRDARDIYRTTLQWEEDNVLMQNSIPRHSNSQENRAGVGIQSTLSISLLGLSQHVLPPGNIIPTPQTEPSPRTQVTWQRYQTFDEVDLTKLDSR